MILMTADIRLSAVIAFLVKNLRPMKQLDSSRTIKLNQPIAVVWNYLTHPDKTQQYMFNCRVETTWKLNAKIEWRGEFEGYQAYQKGIVLACEPERKTDPLDRVADEQKAASDSNTYFVSLEQHCGGNLASVFTSCMPKL